MATSVRVVINIVGHASKRWKGASSEADAKAKNLALSRRRADHVAKLIASEFKKALPNVPIEVREDTTFEENVKVRPGAVGSGRPVMPESKDGDNPFNRSVEVTYVLQGIDTSTETTKVATLREGETEHWSVQQVHLSGVAVVLGVGEAVIRLNNEMTGKWAHYVATLTGRGFYLGKPKSFIRGLTVQVLNRINKQSLGKKAYFTTNKKMGFANFKNCTIYVTKLAVGVGLPIRVPKKVPLVNKLGVKVTDTLLSFKDLGPDAQKILMGFSVMPSGGTSAEFFFMTGELRP